MTAADASVLAGAGLVAGAVNSIAGGGSLLSYPTLLGLGLNPLAANVTNAVGLLSGQASGSWGYRSELRGQRQRLVGFGIPMTIGGVAGVALLLTTPAGTFKLVVPWLILAGCVALLIQPQAMRLLRRDTSERPRALTVGLVFGGVYGGYFGAAVGIMLLALLAVFVDDSLQRLNAAKVVLSWMVSLIAAIGFALFGPVDWPDAAILALAALIGGAGGTTLSRRIPATALRVGVAMVGVGMAVKLLLIP